MNTYEIHQIFKNQAAIMDYLLNHERAENGLRKVLKDTQEIIDLIEAQRDLGR